MNPYSMILNDSNLTNTSQGDLSFIYLIAKALEADYSSGFDASFITPYRFMVEKLISDHGADCPAVRRIKSAFSTWGKMQGQ